MPPKRRYGVWLAASASLLLVGCGDNSADQAWATYHQQLADTLNTTTPERREPRNIGAFPERQQRLIDVPETRDGMLNIYALRECQITSLIAARNNQLGRVAPPSQHWLYERTLWQRLSTCLNSEVPDSLSDDDHARLAQLTELKTAQLPSVSWNAIFDSEEWEKSFSRASSPLPPHSPIDLSSQLAAIEYLRQMVVQQFSLAWEQDSSTLENHLKTLQERPLTAEVLRSLLLAEQRIGEANRLLEREADANACLSLDEPEWIATLALQSQQWLESINHLINSHPLSPPPAIDEYQNNWLSVSNPEAPWQQFQAAWDEHKALKDSFKHCASD
ncbi:DUF3080 family protein [Vreelandella lutescens]|uniref:DUF3080 domain-containing protein n=1 Tax=Vreelandella lutescens TaxID=1602943 RepID=A0ABQ1PKX7_9GAMM|nr:DUF3080 family protein [Halomonas lutescens]GGC98901.1 hypothetical protein GCM10011382_31840 [Halomonas lutescens]